MNNRPRTYQPAIDFAFRKRSSSKRHIPPVAPIAHLFDTTFTRARLSPKRVTRFLARFRVDTDTDAR